MTTTERLQAELEHLSEEDMAELLRVIQRRAQTNGQNAQAPKPGLLTRLRRIKIDAAKDFATSLNTYANRDKKIDFSRPAQAALGGQGNA